MKRHFTIKALSLVLAPGFIALTGLSEIDVMKVSPSPLQHPQATSSGSAVPAPSVPLPLVSSASELKAPTLTPSQAEWLTEANRYLDAKDYRKALPL